MQIEAEKEIQVKKQGQAKKQMSVSKYDRQIRLWGAQGQKNLSQGRVALLGCSGAGIQALKNLVLPAVGHIDIWDTRTVTLEDLSSSFFYAPQDIGKPRAEAASANLLQMNPDVQGKVFVKPISQLLNNHQLLKQYTLLLVGDLSLEEQAKVSRVCWQSDIAVVFVTVVGFYVYIRNQRKVHLIQSERTLAKKYYLRLHDPFPQLQRHSEQWNIPALIEKLGQTKTINEETEATDGKELSQQAKARKALLVELENIPYTVILLQAYHSFPKQKRTRSAIQDLLKEWQMKVGEGHRENFFQASSRYFDLNQDPENFLRDFSRFEYTFVSEATAQSPQPLIFLRACHAFLKKTGHLPQPTDLPDMQTQTKLYLQLKQVYKEQHKKGIQGIQTVLQELYGKVPLTPQTISLFINNLQAIQVQELSPYYKELQLIENPNLQWQQKEWRNILLAIRAYQLFEQKEKRAPTLEDFQAVKAVAESLREQFGFADLSEQRYLQQVCRINGQTVISINSIAGAIAGQQSIKLISHCFTPVQDGFVYSGVHSVGYAVRL